MRFNLTNSDPVERKIWQWWPLNYSLLMIDIKSKIPRNPRSLVAIALLIISLMAAMGIASEAKHSVLIWAAARELVPGTVIRGGDVKTVRTLLPENSSRYYSNKAAVVGLTVLRPIGAMELISTSSITRQPDPEHLHSLPLRIARNDLPTDLTAGQRVDLYALSVSNATNPFDPFLIIQNSVVESIDQKSRELGGDIGVVLSVPERLVLQVVSDISNSRVLVVRNAI